jgi:hypothetical protein
MRNYGARTSDIIARDSLQYKKVFSHATKLSDKNQIL